MWISLLPSLLALVLAFFLGNAAVALGAGAVLGAILVNAAHPGMIPGYLLDGLVIEPLSSPWKLGAVVLTLQLGAFAALLEANGNLERMFHALRGKASAPDRRRALTALSVMGLVCFFDGLANSILLGKIARSLQKSYKVSGALLAYIVDTTSSAVACLVVFSTWTAYQLTLIQENTPTALGTPFGLLVRSIPYNVYSWLSLVVLFAVVRGGYFFGSMRRFENEAAEPCGAVGRPEVSAKPSLPLDALPLVMLFVSFLAMVAALPGSFINGLADNSVPWLLNIAALVAILTAMATRRRGLPPVEAMRRMADGLIAISKPLLILFAAWALSKAIGDLGLATRLAGLFQAGGVPAAWLPALFFSVACVVSFLTGTSWGTLGLLMPLALPMLGQLPEAGASLCPAVIGAVFGGAVFGDHCSPISDTTVVSAFATGTPVRDHARSQMPYALATALAALLFVYVPMALF